tara:strand:- start:664 stop:882 length:219 start_codon:yes stop_codon:yes gene_type:complete
MAPPFTSIFLTESEAAKYLGISKKTLQRWRFDHKGPAYAKLNNKLIRYHLPELDEWMDQQTITHENKESSYE